MDDLYVFTTKEKEFLRRLGESHDGRDLRVILNKVLTAMADVSTIKTGDYGAQVEGRKFAKSFIALFIENMERSKEKQGGDDDDVDEYA